jgi:hypothetical protein
MLSLARLELSVPPQGAHTSTRRSCPERLRLLRFDVSCRNDFGPFVDLTIDVRASFLGGGGADLIILID